MRKSCAGWLMAVCLAVAGCAGEVVPAGDPAWDPALSTTLQVTVGDSVELVLQVMNASESPLTLEFPTAQRYDFDVRRAGALQWRWSGDRSFMQAVSSEQLSPGEVREYRSWWTGSPDGEYEVVGRLTSSSHPVELRAPLTFPH